MSADPLQPPLDPRDPRRLLAPYEGAPAPDPQAPSAAASPAPMAPEAVAPMTPAPPAPLAPAPPAAAPPEAAAAPAEAAAPAHPAGTAPPPPAAVAPQPASQAAPAGDHLQQAIGELRAAIAVSGVMVATADGLSMAYDLPNDDSLRIAAMSATALGLGQRLVESFGHGEFAESVTRGSEGYFVVYGAGPEAVLAVIAPEGTNLGLLHHEARRIARRIAEALA